MNLQTQRQLPYIQIKNPPLKLLIDTGANQSFLSPEAVRNYYPHVTLDHDPFEVTNVHATTRSQYSISIPGFPEFNERNKIKLFVYKFHNHFDGLIGLDLLSEWEAKIDLKFMTLTTRNAVNIISLYNSQNLNLYEDIIPAHSSKLLKVPVHTTNGDVYIPQQMLSNCITHKCLTTVYNNRGLIEVENPTPHDIIFSLDRPARAELFSIVCARTDATQSERAKRVLER